MITIEQVIQQVDEIRFFARSGDYERAHSAEDALMVEVLGTIARGMLTAYEAANLASEALKTGAIEFSRYTA